MALQAEVGAPADSVWAAACELAPRESSRVFSSARKRNEQAEATHRGDVVHHAVDAELYALLRMDEIARIESQREPLGQIELHAESGGSGEAEIAGLDGGAGAE
jgi:hypothetical protein